MSQVNILMMGGKRCGKTTVLASMYGEIDKALAGTKLSLKVDDAQTEQELKRARRERVCQDDFCKFSKFKYLSAEKSPNISCLHIS